MVGAASNDVDEVVRGNWDTWAFETNAGEMSRLLLGTTNPEVEVAKIVIAVAALMIRTIMMHEMFVYAVV